MGDLCKLDELGIVVSHKRNLIVIWFYKSPQCRGPIVCSLSSTTIWNTNFSNKSKIFKKLEVVRFKAIRHKTDTNANHRWYPLTNWVIQEISCVKDGGVGGQELFPYWGMLEVTECEVLPTRIENVKLMKGGRVCGGIVLTSFACSGIRDDITDMSV